MYTKVLSSDKETFLFALEELKEKLERVDFDFLIFAISPIFNYAINETIQKIFKTNNYIAFHAIDSFCDNFIKEKSVVVLAIKFEKEGKIYKFFVDDVTDEQALKTADYLNNNKDKFHLIFASYSDAGINTFIEKISDKLNYFPVNNIAGGVASEWK
jgi:DNA-binding MltR family transcriptional regulator